MIEQGGKTTEIRESAAAIRVEVDVNTAPEVSDLPKGKELAPLYRELFGLARELVNRGDVK
jgi:hypothetical protein